MFYTHETYIDQKRANTTDKRRNKKQLVKEEITKDKIYDVHTLEEYLSQFPELTKYRIDWADFEEEYWRIPLDILTSVTGLTKQDVFAIAKNNEAYEAYVKLVRGKKTGKEFVVLTNGS